MSVASIGSIPSQKYLSAGRTPSQDELVNKVNRYIRSFSRTSPEKFRSEIFKERRTLFADKLPNKSLAIIVGGTEYSRNLDIEFPFRQESNFYYLTGFDEPDSIALIEKKDESTHIYTLFVRSRDPAKELWTGLRAGVSGAESDFHADKALNNDLLIQTLTTVCKAAEKIFLIPAVTNKAKNELIESLLNKEQRQYEDSSHVVHKMRVVKSPYEIALIKRANNISGKGHVIAMLEGKLNQELIKLHRSHAKGRNEGEIQAVIESEFRKRGAQRLAYPTIVTSPKNCAILHYVQNSAYAKPGDLILVDAGCEYGYQAADITRTWPLSGKFTKEQAAIYNLVLKAQKAGIKAAVVDTTLEEIQKVSEKILVKGLQELGVVKGDLDAIAAKIRDFFPHGIGHFLGMDVHDVTGETDMNFKQVPLPAGAVITVEPGIYIAQDNTSVDPKWRGIGIRIEDNILITAEGPINLSSGIPKELLEIESMML